MAEIDKVDNLDYLKKSHTDSKNLETTFFVKIGSVFVKFKLSVLCNKVCVFLRACVRVHAGGECIFILFLVPFAS